MQRTRFESEWFPLLLIEGDITQSKVDAIVNAANNQLAGGGGVDGAIHRAAGPELDAACQQLGGCPTGEAKLTPGFQLPASYILHTVGPVWRGGKHQEPELLRRCYRNCMVLAQEHSLKTLAFPAISCGVYGYPLSDAMSIAIDELYHCYQQAPDAFLRLELVLFDEASARQVVALLAEWQPPAAQ